jgi:hypothetical protein
MAQLTVEEVHGSQSVDLTELMNREPEFREPSNLDRSTLTG